MKQIKQRFIWGLYVAVLLFLAKPLLPHHHHGGEACFIVEYCQEDHVDNDAHTHHHGDLSTCGDHGAGACAIKSSQAKQTLQLRPDFLPSVSVFLQPLCLSSIPITEETQVSFFSIPPAPMGRKGGLRAPPYAGSSRNMTLSV